MNSLETKRTEFRKYLEEAGVINGLSKCLIKLYEIESKPKNAVKFIRDNICEGISDEKYAQLEKEFAAIKNKLQQVQIELAREKGNKKLSASDALLRLEHGLTDLETDDNCKSLLKKYLTRDLYDELKDLKTQFGSTLLDCIQSGLENHDSNIGVYAADAEAYSIFEKLFNPIIEEYHKGFTSEMTHPSFEWGDPSTLGNLDPDNKYVISSRIRCARSNKEYPFNPRMSEAQYIESMNRMREILTQLEGDFKGDFYPIADMEAEFQNQLIDEHFLFKEGDRFLQAARSCRFWPVGRAIFYNKTKTFLVWINEEDHLRFISMQKGGDLGTIYQRLIDGVEKCSEHIEFSKHKRFGWLTFCPTNLGTTIRASVHIQLPKLSSDYSTLEKVADKYNLQVRGTRGEHTEAEEGIYDVSNKRRMGLTEYEAVKEMYDGITEIIKIENEM